MRFAIMGSRGYPSTYGGFETFVRRFAPYLRDAGDDVVVYGRGTGVRTRSEVIDDIEVVTTANIDKKSLSTLVSGLTSSIHARKQDFDAALVLNCANGPFLPVLRRATVPTAVNVDGIEWERDKWSRLGKAVFRLGADTTARFADEIIVDAVEIGRIWKDRFDVESTFIPYGADVVTDLADDRLADVPVEAGSYVLAVARLVPENNVELLLDALDRLDPAIPVVIVGSANYDSPVDHRLQAFVATHPNAHALGHVHDQELLSQLWAHCGLYFHGHSVGGTNPALLQALGFGSPVLALETAFNREVIGHDDQLVPLDAAIVAERLEAVLDSRSRQAELRARGQATIADRYQWDDVCRDYRDVLVRLADGRAG